jgi:hypothetical protein
MTSPSVEALDRRFQERCHQVPVLARRAKDEGVTAIREYADLVPLLFPHTTYKSYPEALVHNGRWAQLNRWLDSVSTHRVAEVDVTGVEDLDGWIERLESAGHLVSSSSGTSGKSSFLNKSLADRAASMTDMLDCLTGIGIPPDPSWHVIPVGPDTGVKSHAVMRDLFIDNYSRSDAIVVPPGKASGGHHRYMARLGAMRRQLADGTARPDEIAAFEAEAAARRAENEQRQRYFAEQILDRRTERMLFNAMFPMLWDLCRILRDIGATPGDISGANAVTTGGGLKGMPLPEDYQAQIFALLNLDRERFLHYYSMQELNLRMPKCGHGRYHVPPAIVLLVLDQPGESLAPVSDGQVEGRAAFFDLTVDGRWGGTISGDRIRAEFGVCPCGRPGPTVFDEISRYADLADGDKITCAGTMDAYVRGFLAD